jgi:hypothetical protein
VYADPGTLSISLNTNAWEIGTVPVGGKADTWLADHGMFAVSNSGDVAATLYISVSNSTPAGWEPGEAPGWDRFSMGWSAERGRALPQYSHILAPPVLMQQTLATNEVLEFDLEFLAPTGSDELGVQQQIRVTIMAVEE